MANFIPNKLNPSDINGGQRFKNGDAITAETMNRIVEGTLAGETGVQDYVNNTFANALKGKVIGEAVAMKDISPVLVPIRVSVSGVDNLSGVKVKKLGKNILPYPYKAKSQTYNGITYTINSDGTVLVNGTATSSSYIDLTAHNFTATLAGKTVCLSGCPKGGTAGTYLLRWQIRDENNTTLVSADDIGSGVTVNVPEQATKGIPRITVMVGATVNNLVFKPQTEFGTTATAYEPYIAPTEYPVNADGTVEGVTPIPSGTTLLTDTAGAVITAEYNRDINKAFEELVNAIISLGGKV